MYSKLVGEWYNFYNRIEKKPSKEIVLNTHNIKSPKDFDKELLVYLARTKGLDYIDNMIKDLKARNAFTKKVNKTIKRKNAEAKKKGKKKVFVERVSPSLGAFDFHGRVRFPNFHQISHISDLDINF